MEQEISFALATGFWAFMAALIVWSLVWKGLALWHSAKKGQKWWFIIFLILQTAGILEIIYLVFIAKIWGKKDNTAIPPPVPTAPPAPASPAASVVSPVATPSTTATTTVQQSVPTAPPAAPAETTAQTPTQPTGPEAKQ